MLRRAALSLVLTWCLAPLAAAQGLSLPDSPFLTVEFERLFADSVYGTRFEQEIEAESEALAAENRRIEAELADEERRLTEMRAEMEPEAFRELANAFDEKVQTSRREQDAKVRALGTRRETAQREFLRAAEPVLAEIMRDTGATAIFERRTVFISADAIDITDEAIARINAEAAGQGPDAPSQD
ncbi:OmpH family outer membrane protein [Aestuariicoccus sp. MJ-SS9]|uniref:OmpH family outer membrane protein n=1 Tax=Aestuariicoccus sp. MJ-SS9 TaxID=3079855 RepID=UPI00290B6101|nr:OmpH family outer membrane protein [Aestuariicoccus sp. MJ-SS9]MDU8913042.1 OmpH family outer membrane protein [Aestuariicoccus sp. MJ-SS9]